MSYSAANAHNNILCFWFSLLILTPIVSSQNYFFIKELNTFDDAVASCKSRGDNLVEIRSEEEQEFIWAMIVEPSAVPIWLGATNIIGTINFKWLTDGSDVTTHYYTNWHGSYPDKDVNQRNGISMFTDSCEWYDLSVCNTLYVLCERDLQVDLPTKLIENIDHCNTTIKQQDSQLTTVIKSVQDMKESNDARHDQVIKTQFDLNDKLNRLSELNAVNNQVLNAQETKLKQQDSQLNVSASTQREEYLLLISEVKQDHKRCHDKMVEFIQVNSNKQNDCPVQQQNRDICSKLEAQTNDMATELEFQKQVISKLNDNNQRLEKLNQKLESRVSRLTVMVEFALKRLPTAV